MFSSSSQPQKKIKKLFARNPATTSIITFLRTVASPLSFDSQRPKTNTQTPRSYCIWHRAAVPQIQIHNQTSLSNSLARFCKTRGLSPWRELCRVHTSFPAPAPPTPRRCWKKRSYCLRWGSGKHEQHWSVLVEACSHILSEI